MKLHRHNRFIYGFVPGLVFPLLFVVLYLKRFYPLDIPIREILVQLFPSVILGKLLLLSIVPNLLFVFIFYKQDTFRLGIGMMIGGMVYLALAMYML